MKNIVKIEINADSLTKAGILPGPLSNYANMSEQELILELGQEIIMLPARVAISKNVDAEGKMYLSMSREDIILLLNARGVASSSTIKSTAESMTMDRFVEVSLRGMPNTPLTINDLREIYTHLSDMGEVVEDSEAGAKDVIDIISGAITKYSSMEEIIGGMQLIDDIFSILTPVKFFSEDGYETKGVLSHLVTPEIICTILNAHEIDYCYDRESVSWVVIK